MIAGHTKNVVNETFEHAKRKLKNNDIWTARDIISVVKTINETTDCVFSSNVVWRLSKSFLERLFRISSSFPITKYHVLRFSSANPGCMYVKERYFYSEDTMFCMLKRGFTLDDIRRQITYVFEDSAFVPSIIPLSLVSSIQHCTRKGHVEHNIVYRYYSNNAEMRQEFFKDGMGGW